jgi:uncharacterized protein YbjT (DUF2867 family)
MSIVGSDQLPESGYLRAKVAQEKLVEESEIPYSIVRAQRSRPGNRRNQQRPGQLRTDVPNQ